MTFKQWLVIEGGKGSGTKLTGTGAPGTGGMAQHGRVFRITSPHSFKVNYPPLKRVGFKFHSLV